MDSKNLNRRRYVLIYALTAAGILFWIAALLGAPWLRSRSFGGSGFIYACFAPVCHQIPARSFFLWGYPLAVCARCFGVYTGFAGGVLLYPFLRGWKAPRLPRLKTLVLFSAPIVFDTAGNFLRIWDTGGILRFLTGIFWGLILPFYFLTGLAELFAFPRTPSSQNSTRSDSPPDSPVSREIPQ
jgi:uncharacterized membrane protein